MRLRLHNGGLNGCKCGITTGGKRFIKKRGKIIKCHRDSSYWRALCALFWAMSMLRCTIGEH